MTAAVDTFARDRLPPPGQLPEFLFETPELQFPPRLNCVVELLDRRIAAGEGGRPCLLAPGGLRWSYADLRERVDRIAQVLVRELGLRPGQRVLLRAPNTPMMAACWLAVVKAGGIAVPTMPLLRAVELRAILAKAQVGLALCDRRLAEELAAAADDAPQPLRCLLFATGEPDSGAELDAAMARHPEPFEAFDSAADDTCLLAFTSGTTGVPKATMHFHRDILAACACWPRHVLRPRADDVFAGSPPLAFTFGLGGLLLFPLSVGASVLLLERVTPADLVQGIVEHGVTTLFTAPTSYRNLAAFGAQLRASALRQCVSAGEALPAATRQLWREATGIELIDGIGSTELLHIFISADEREARPGATGKVVPGYRACVVDEALRPLPPGEVGRLAVKGPTGCRYLDDERQRQYVQGGWNLTGDAYRMDADGYFHYQARTDDLIVSAGYNIAAPEVEGALLLHPAVAECGVIGVGDEARGQIVKAFVVLRPGHAPSAALAAELQAFVRSQIAPYKYPRALRFIAALPRTGTGKIQRFRLRDLPEEDPQP
ncbi:MAG: AMP-binding protein [Burkholderiaceae bacterium]|nr:AMP-binding protein [Burkholderiaceae bacterium]